MAALEQLAFVWCGVILAVYLVADYFWHLW